MPAGREQSEQQTNKGSLGEADYNDQKRIAHSRAGWADAIYLWCLALADQLFPPAAKEFRTGACGETIVARISGVCKG